MPIGMIEEFCLDRTELVETLVTKEREQKAALLNFKSISMPVVVTFVEMAAEKYGAFISNCAAYN